MKNTVSTFKEQKVKGDKITMLTAYDYSTCLLYTSDQIFFTGSPNVGHAIMEAAAKHLTPVVLELGGKSPCIVDETANVKRAAQRVAWGKGINCGQTCVAPDYFLVHERVADDFVRQLDACFHQYYGEDVYKRQGQTTTRGAPEALEGGGQRVR